MCCSSFYKIVIKYFRKTFSKKNNYFLVIIWINIPKKIESKRVHKNNSKQKTLF